MRSALGKETSLTSFFAAAIGRRSKEAIRRASASTKPSSSVSGSARSISHLRLRSVISFTHLTRSPQIRMPVRKRIFDVLREQAPQV